MGGGERVARVARVRELGQLRCTEPRVEVVDGRSDAGAQQPRLARVRVRVRVRVGVSGQDQDQS